MNFNCLVVETNNQVYSLFFFFFFLHLLEYRNKLREYWLPRITDNIEPNDIDLELNAVAYTHKTFSIVEDFTLLWWHSRTRKRLGRMKQSDQIDNEERFYWKSIVKTKHQSLTSLAFIRLVPGADGVVRHIWG